MTKSIPKKKKCKKAKWLSDEGLQIAVKRREVKGKGERERYNPSECRVPVNPRRDKEAFSSEQCKDIEESSRLGKTRDLCKKVGDTMVTFYAKMETIKDRSNNDLTEVIKRSGKNTQKKCTKRGLNDLNNHNVVITHLEPDNLESQVK